MDELGALILNPTKPTSQGSLHLSLDAISLIQRDPLPSLDLGITESPWWRRGVLVIIVFGNGGFAGARRRVWHPTHLHVGGIGPRLARPFIVVMGILWISHLSHLSHLCWLKLGEEREERREGKGWSRRGKVAIGLMGKKNGGRRWERLSCRLRWFYGVFGSYFCVDGCWLFLKF